MHAIQPYLDYFTQHPGWAIAIVFLIAFGEALLIIGLFVPSTAVLVGAGMLVGTGHLEFWPIFAATAVGCILGDQISYWAGRLFGERLKTLWPLNRYPALVARGEEFVRLHGGKSIAIGRFVPGVKAVVPGIAGMFGMSQAFFFAVNISSGLIWAFAHILPGVVAGQMLALAGDLSERLLIVLLILIVILVGVGWLIRLGAIALIPPIERAQARIHAWSLTRAEKRWRRLGRILAPGNPRAISVIVFAAIAVTMLLLFIQLAASIVGGERFANADISIFKMMRSIRNEPADELMITLTMFGDWIAIVALSLAMLAWLVWRRAWRAAVALVAVVAISKLFVVVIKDWMQRPRPLELAGLPEAFSFPSSHATMATVCFGVLAVLAGQSLGRWGRAIAFTLAFMASIVVGYSRIYLGAHWLSDVLAGLLFGAVMTAAFGVAVEAMPPRRIKPLGLAAASLGVYLVAGAFYVSAGYADAARLYAPQAPVVRYTLSEWQAGAWASLPARRIDLAGKPEEPFIAQWAGSTDAISAALARDGWSQAPRWTWRAGVPYLDPHAALATLQPRPLLHEGLPAGMTFIKPIPGEDTRRLVIRVWRTDFELAQDGIADPIHMISITRDVLRRGWNLYAIPASADADVAETSAAIAALEKDTRVSVLAAVGRAKDDRGILVVARP
jgi:membrane protein DedA with SNARE-associated domain/membrane-associated phospholipid phosphatase